jgi:putative transposase
MLNKRHSVRFQRLDYSLPNKFFVTVCCHQHGCYIGKSPQLNNIIDHEIKVINQYFPNVSIPIYAIMPNHLHLIIEIKYQIQNITLGKIVGSLKSKIVNQWLKHIKQNKLNLLASIWQRNYFEHRIRNQTELKKFSKYIELNPTNWNKDRYNPTNFKAQY